MFSSAWHSCLANLSRAPDCPDRYGAKSRTGISAASLLFIGEGAALIVDIPVSQIGFLAGRIRTKLPKSSTGSCSAVNQSGRVPPLGRHSSAPRRAGTRARSIKGDVAPLRRVLNRAEGDRVLAAQS